MTSPGDMPPLRRFADYIGEIGPRWGLPADACRTHGYLYAVARAASEVEMGKALELEPEALNEALAYLVEYRMIQPAGENTWATGSDPWELLLRGLEARQRMELPQALAILRGCSKDAAADPGTDPAIERQISRMLALAEDLAAINASAQRLSPRVLRRMIGISGRAARFMDRNFGIR